MHVWGDGSNVRHNGHKYDDVVASESFLCHHFGAVRHPARLRQKFRHVGQILSGEAPLLQIPSFVFDLLPYDWLDKDFIDDLAIYPGPYVKAVLDKPDEFVRDRLKLHDYLVRRERHK
jgi:hypothetical protein